MTKTIYRKKKLSLIDSSPCAISYLLQPDRTSLAKSTQRRAGSNLDWCSVERHFGLWARVRCCWVCRGRWLLRRSNSWLRWKRRWEWERWVERYVYIPSESTNTGIYSPKDIMDWANIETSFFNQEAIPLELWTRSLAHNRASQPCNDRIWRRGHKIWAECLHRNGCIVHQVFRLERIIRGLGFEVHQPVLYF